jgi:hypothetical protein
VGKFQQLASHIIPVSFDAATVLDASYHTQGLEDFETERLYAWRSLRQSSWAGAFYLCTKDILGSFNAPYAFRQNR